MIGGSGVVGTVEDRCERRVESHLDGSSNVWAQAPRAEREKITPGGYPIERSFAFYSTKAIDDGKDWRRAVRYLAQQPDRLAMSTCQFRVSELATRQHAKEGFLGKA